MWHYVERALAGRRKKQQPDQQPAFERYVIIVNGPYGIENSKAPLFLRLRPDFNFAYNLDEDDHHLLYDYLPPRLIEEIKNVYSGILMSVMLPESHTFQDGEVIILKGVEVRLKKKLSFTIDERGGLEGSRPIRHVVVYGYSPTSIFVR